jgi:outer membrane protein assembly factor BamB
MICPFLPRDQRNNSRIWLSCAITAWALTTFPDVAPAADLPWPQFRGPGGQGHAAAVGLPVKWSESENVAWKTLLPGEGWSSPVVANGRIWLTAASLDGLSLRVLAVDEKTGKLLHDVEVFHRAEPLPKNSKNSFASPTAVVDDTHVFVHYGTQGTACLDQQTAKVVWTNTDLQLDHKEGPGSSPILWNDLLFITCDGMDVQFVAALDKRKGTLRWKTERSGKPADNPDHRKAYTTPLVINVAGQEQLISPGADRVIAYEPATGRELWKVEYKGFSIVPRPVLAHDLLYITTAFARPELWAIRTGGTGDVTESHVAWKLKKQVPSSPSSLVVDKELYLISDKGILTVLDAVNGEELYTERLGGNFSASPLYVDGHVLLFREDGLSYVLKPGRSYELLQENQLDGRILATPAAIGRTLFLRTDTAIYRIEQPSADAGVQAAN